MPSCPGGYPPRQWHSATDVKSDAHEEWRPTNSVELCGTTPRGPCCGLENKHNSSVEMMLESVLQ
jgi:hypothetical protein